VDLLVLHMQSGRVQHGWWQLVGMLLPPSPPSPAPLPLQQPPPPPKSEQELDNPQHLNQGPGEANQLAVVMSRCPSDPKGHRHPPKWNMLIREGNLGVSDLSELHQLGSQRVFARQGGRGQGMKFREGAQYLAQSS
jgi:hypothetical protein